jgi:hypothetical protein
MQVPTLDVATIVPVQTGAGVTARVVSGNLAQVPVGALLEATVTSVSPREVALTVNGLPFTVRPPVGLPPFQPGAVLLVRVPTAATATNPTLELALPANPAPGQKPTPAVTSRVTEGTSRTASSETAAVATRATPTSPRAAESVPLPVVAQPPRLAVVDVVSQLPNGRVQVQIDGVEQIATASEPLASGGRYVLQVERSPAGIKLNPPPDSPKLPTEVATAVLRTPAPTLPTALKPLQAELATLAAPPAGGNTRPVPVAVRQAASAVEATLQKFLPSESRPPDAAQLRQLVENGGLHFEAKLARLVEGPDAPATNTAKPDTTAVPRESQANPTSAKPEQPAREVNVAAREPNATVAQTSDRAASPTIRDLGPDLKGDLLRLLQAVNDVGGATRAPAAEAVVRGIESQQAANAIAQASGTPYFLQVPFPDGGQWRTLNLSLEPQYRPDQADAERAGRFRVFMHVPLNDLGETWIDAGLAGDQFRATIYLDRAEVRDRVRAALPELRTELQTDGFSEVLLDVKSSSELPAGRRRESSAMQAGRPETVSVLDVRA